jgi:hypothetical protein
MTKSESNAEREIRWALAVRSFWEKIKSNLESHATAAPDAQQNNGLVVEIANLAQVPSEGIATLKRGILCELMVNPQHTWPKSPAAVGSKKRAVAQLRSAAGLLRQLYTILSDLDQQALEALLDVNLDRRNNSQQAARDKGAPRPPQPFPSLSDFKSSWVGQIEIIAELAELSSEALDFVRRRPPPKPRGRPRRGAFSTWFSNSLVELTFELLLDVRAAGGHLTLDKNACRGTLIEALTLLRPHLTPGLIPRVLPLSTLAKVKALDQKIAATSSPGP